MTLGQYMISLGKRWKLLVICIVVLGVGAYIGSKLMTPIYQSITFVQVAVQTNNNVADYNSLLASDQLVQTEAQLVTSEAVLSEVASHYPGMSVELLSKEVSASPQPNTQLFEINVQDPSPIRAADFANDIATTLIKQQTQLALQGSTGALQRAQQNLDQTQQQITSTEGEIAGLQAKQGSIIEMSNLNAQLNSLQQRYIQELSVIDQLEMTQTEESNFLVIVQHAFPALSPLRPNLFLNTGIGLLAGLLLAMSLVLLAEQFGTPVRTLEAVSQLLGCPVLVTFLRVESKDEVVNPIGDNVNSEAYRILRTNIGFSTIDKPLHTILITSATTAEGKSTVAANLAIFMAKAGKNTLLIDADLRRPTQHQQFGLPLTQLGLSDAIAAFNMMASKNSFSHQQFLSPLSAMNQASPSISPNFSINPFMCPLSIPNLCVMPSGTLPPNPSELLDSKAMQHLLATINSCGAEVVIFDAPPLLGLTDASILASQVDGTLVVVDSTHANKGNLRQVKAVLRQASANVIGAVVNKQRRGHDQTIFSYYGRAQEQESMDNRHAASVPSNILQ